MKKILVIIVLTLMASLAGAETWKCVIYGDTRSNDDHHREVLQAIMNYTPDYKFIINVGDVVNDGTSTTDWNTWQSAIDDVLGGAGQTSTPPKYMSTPGNHDATETSTGLANWYAHLPGQTDQFGNEGKFFTFDFEDTRFLVMDSDKSDENGPQLTMMNAAIINNQKKWLITVWHHPIFDYGEKSYEDEFHDLWGVPLYQNGCDIIFNGHAHYYVRTSKLALNGELNPPIDDVNGIPQIVTGNGGASLDVPDINHDNNAYMVESYNPSADTKYYGYSELTFTDDTLFFKHILTDGTVFDEEEYVPNPKTTTQIDNKISQIPENISLIQNYPNPFNPETTIAFNLKEAGQVEMKIYRSNGVLVETLLSAQLLSGHHTVKWDATDYASGIYFVSITHKQHSYQKKMILLK